jgi:hypothetical protein
MKKVLLIILGIALTYGLDAQSRYGVKLGGTLSSLYSKSTGEGGGSNNTDPKIGIEAGALLEYSFSPSLALQPELLYVNNGGKQKAAHEGESISERIILHQLQLPINIKYKMGTDKLKFYVAAGPYLGYIFAARSKQTYKNENEGINESRNNNLYGDGSDMKHFDFGMGVGFGVELLNKYIVGTGYKYGISSLTKTENVTLRTGTFNLSVGYFF